MISLPRASGLVPDGLLLHIINSLKMIHIFSASRQNYTCKLNSDTNGVPRMKSTALFSVLFEVRKTAVFQLRTLGINKHTQ